MKLRDFVTPEKIALNVNGRETLPIWDTEISDDDVAKLSDAAYLGKIAHEHKEMQAWSLARYANAKYEPKAMAKRTGIPEVHIWAFWALNGSRGQGLYS